MAKTKDNNQETVERYATSLFYPSRPESSPRNYHTFGQGYGISGSPTNSAATSLSRTRMPASIQRPDVGRQDQIVFSCEVSEFHNGSFHDNDTFRRPTSSGSAGGRFVQSHPRSISGPVYSTELLTSLDALLNG